MRKEENCYLTNCTEQILIIEKLYSRVLIPNKLD